MHQIIVQVVDQLCILVNITTVFIWKSSVIHQSLKPFYYQSVKSLAFSFSLSSSGTYRAKVVSIVIYVVVVVVELVVVECEIAARAT